MPSHATVLRIAAGALALALSLPAHAAIRFVDASLATGANDGTSWANAYQGAGGVAAALTGSVSGDEIWVRAGTYKPTTGTSRTVFLTMKSGVGIHGGFAGTGNLNADPQFVNAAGGDWRLQPTSPGIDSGTNAQSPTGGMASDLAGNARYVDVASVPDTGVGPAPIIDRGAYEVQQPPPACPCDLDGDEVVDGNDLGVLLGGWGAPGPADLNGDGLVDGNDLGIMLGAWGPC